jgi:hypothetical protein
MTRRNEERQALTDNHDREVGTSLGDDLMPLKNA